MEKEQTITIPLTRIVYFLTEVYIFVIVVLLPLYHRDGFCYIGDRKYRLFFMSASIMTPIILLLYFIKISTAKEKLFLCVTDKCMLAYAGVVVGSTLCSNYRETAVWGYADWHMGAMSQLLFVLTYFAVSRGLEGKSADGKKAINRLLVFAVVISGLVFLLGVLNRFAVDPLQMFEGLEYWNKTHLLATIGNINWYCGYACTIFPLGLYYFWSQPQKAGNTMQSVALAAYVCLTFATMVTQGSESGLVVMAVVLVLYMGFSVGDKARVERFLQMQTLLGGTVSLLGILYTLCDKEQIYFAADLQIEKLITSRVWWVYTIVAVLLFARCHFSKQRKWLLGLEEEKSSMPAKEWKIWAYLLTGLVVTGGVVLLHAYNQQFLPVLNRISILNLNKGWGSGRGLLWQVTGKAYFELSPWKRMIGVGPDCFAPYLYERNQEELSGFLAEWWGDARVANAHNEWLNVLLNTGLLGLFSYIGIFVSAGYSCINRKKKEMTIAIGFLTVIIAYAINNTVSFQQVTATPILFVMLGMMQYFKEN